MRANIWSQLWMKEGQSEVVAGPESSNNDTFCGSTTEQAGLP